MKRPMPLLKGGRRNRRMSSRRGEQGDPRGRRPSRRRRPSESVLYRQFAHAYDLAFQRFFAKGIEDAIGQLGVSPGQRVLEVGVGTGLSLPYYPAGISLTAIDLSPQMLQQAQRRAEQLGLEQVDFRCMDALALEFADDHFDFVGAFHVVTVVPDPKRLAAEMWRVCKPGGKLVVVNHFRSPRPWIAPFIDMLNPVTQYLGWRTDLALDHWLEGIPVEVERRYKLSPTSLFTTVIATKTPGG
ncbi:MAG: SAM-dependent methyltransferase [Pirellulaceae bacterium]|nr:MAG: SAM-dependent methyltransferase [Pirellulaceae bacterium]